MTDGRAVWLDTDPALGIPFKDVDDGLAILLAVASPELVVEGISVNFGNVDASRGLAVARDLLSRVDSGAPVFEGASSRHELGNRNPAVEALLKKVEEKPGQISLVAVAPLTNVASAMILDRSFARNLRELVVMGGALSFWPLSFFGDFNFHLDGRAAQIVMSAPVRKTLITMDLCSQVVFKRGHLERLRAHGSANARRLADEIAPWLLLNRVVFRRGGFVPWDPIAVAYLLAPDMFDSHPCTFTVVPHGWRRGRILDLEGREGFEPVDGKVPVNVPREVDAERFMDLLLDRLLSLWHSSGPDRIPYGE